MKQHQVGQKPHPLANKPDHLWAHRAHMRNVRFSQKRGTWTRLTRAISAWNMRIARGDKFSDHEQRMFDGAVAELKLVEDQLDQMTAEAEAEYAAEDERKHMERCLAVQRRGQLERVLRKINVYEAWERAIETGVVVGIHRPDDPPLSERGREELAILYKMRDEIVAEMDSE